MCAWRPERFVGAVALLSASLSLACEGRHEARKERAERAGVEFQREPIQPIAREARAPRITISSSSVGVSFTSQRCRVTALFSCRSCHDLEQGGDGNRRFSAGIGGKEGTINAPTVYNAAFNFVQFWDGRAATLEEQSRRARHGRARDGRQLGGRPPPAG